MQLRESPQDHHWLYSIVPASWDQAKWWQVPLWTIFGNDDAGIFGERDPFFTHIPDNVADISFWGFVKWQARNPLHSLFWTVLRWDAGDNALILYARDETGSRFWFRAPQRTWHADQGKQLYVRLLAPFISYRGARWEIYAGWRIGGALGFALRK